MSTDADSGRSSLVRQFRHGLRREQIHDALADVRNGWKHYELWGTLGLHDVRQRYRRSKLGPFWITISMGIMVLALGLLYGQIFGQDLHDYLPFLAAGFVIWGLISAIILDGSEAFIAAEGMIKQLNAPLSIYVYRKLWSALIAFAHNIWVFVGVALWFGVSWDWSLLWVFPALALLLLNGLWIGLFFGLLSARFRDVPLIIASMVQVLFFITPVIWKPEMLPGRALLLHLNPFYHLVEVIRAPLLGQPPALTNWLAVLLLAAVGWAVTLLFYSAYRWRIAYWV
ncbi:ABC transporter permease [Marichromatium gracile]|uniref:ABC transporter permease n=1 Tax=Marichromatium gracile TaxID=1048 RepID=A0A4R4AKS0_MARGR|nr:ABC transporter permease [Marichromatium gracile]RNE90499.1 ABC transporter permease [Marichromatium sp. AB32]RNE91850.1 ABC transporter permease [Marichromatium sp. AB31]KXX66331.1 ABC transporter permease [Marichromatium gracile]MBK1707676.1 ABC transporter permease [Marichromatium gracile]TCW40028.1 ABC-2 type transport system permease protein/lipopolysaccharide transport system permease protein [Marichromatium gracile]